MVTNRFSNSLQITAMECFDVLTVDQKSVLQQNQTEVEFEKGETIIKRGLAASSILFLEDGLAKLDIIIDGKTSTVGLIQPQSFIGIICTFANRNLNFSAIALEKTRVSVISMEFFEYLVQQNGDFAFRVIQHMSFLTNNLVHHIARFTHKNIEGTLAILLLEFADIYNSDTFTIPVNRKEIAQIIGYSVESVINTLSKFNREGFIVLKNSKITLVDKVLLSRISEVG
jgi:CRP-like cAMP-binding protein